MYRFTKLGITNRAVGVIAAVAIMLATSSCQHEVDVKPQAKIPTVKPVEQPHVQDDDEDAPPKNGHSGT